MSFNTGQPHAAFRGVKRHACREAETLRCDFSACSCARNHTSEGEDQGRMVLMQTKQREMEKERQKKKKKKSYVVCMYSLQSFLVRPCFCLSPDIYSYLCCTSCWFCFRDIRPKLYTRLGQRWEKE